MRVKPTAPRLRVNDTPTRPREFAPNPSFIHQFKTTARFRRRRKEAVKPHGCRVAVKTTGIVCGRKRPGGRSCITGETGPFCPGFAMLSVPTLWTVLVINFLALGLIWAYVQRTYPS